ncbi:DUF1963 domain-containing protein [Streptomyces albidoflavus]|nr:DUF1963 domain-containing protein [Streptomyces albidoflavus]
MRSDLLQLPAIRARLDRFRTQALASGVPAEEIARWTAAARPCLTLTPDGDGPVVARLGGPALVPPRSPGLPHPRYHHVVTVDLAALPREPDMLSLPAGGRLLLFAAYSDGDGVAVGSALHVPSGSPLVERVRDTSRDHPGYAWAGLDALLLELRRALRVTYDVSLPDNETLYDAAEHPGAHGLRHVWRTLHTRARSHEGAYLRIGGYSDDPYGEGDILTLSGEAADRAAGRDPRPVDPWEPPRPADWALLAQWKGLTGGNVYWLIRREDAAGARFDRAACTGFSEEEDMLS